MSEKDKRPPPIIAGTFRQKRRLSPIVNHTIEGRDVLSIEDLLRRLLAEDQAELERWRQRRGETE